VGPLGYNGSKAAMELIAQADVVLALGTRLNPFSTLPSYGIDYWPKHAKIIQVDINASRIGLTKNVDVAIQGDARQVAEQILGQLSANAGDDGREKRRELITDTNTRWQQELAEMIHEADDDPGITWNERSRKREPNHMSPRQAWQAIMQAMPENAMISSDIGNNCAIGNAYPSFEEGRRYFPPGLFGPCGYGLPSILGAKIGCPDIPAIGFAGDGAFGISMNEMTACGRNDWPAITMVIFRNYQWGAEKRNTTLWYDDNFVGTELNVGVEYAKVAEACGVKGVKVETMEDLTNALNTAVKEQMEDNLTTFIEVILNQELGEPFRRDAMKAPVAVAGIKASDMKPQQGG
jgi:sulfoacetaldehyde acetyltransferase